MDYEKVATDLLHAIEAALGFFRAENPHEAERILRSAVEELCHVEEQNPEDFCCGISGDPIRVRGDHIILPQDA